MTTPRRVVVFGTGDFARIARVYLDADSDHDVVAFCAHRDRIGADELEGLPVVPFETVTETHPPGEHAFFVAVAYKGVNTVRAGIVAEAKAKRYPLVTYVSSTVRRWPQTRIGEHCFIFEENVLQPYVTIGDDVILWSGNHVGHDSTIEDHCFIASHAVISGNVTIGHSTFVGVNATFRDGVTVGPRCVIGGGAVVMGDVEEGSVLAVRGTEPKPFRSWELRNF
jgi:sugar O-acyltransferase (sialic acid O-acetyltransferase NeuD family)